LLYLCRYNLCVDFMFSTLLNQTLGWLLMLSWIHWTMVSGNATIVYCSLTSWTDFRNSCSTQSLSSEQCNRELALKSTYYIIYRGSLRTLNKQIYPGAPKFYFQRTIRRKINPVDIFYWISIKRHPRICV
jgi:hypothetical protein